MTKETEKVEKLFNELKLRFESEYDVAFSETIERDGYWQVRITNTEEAKDRREAAVCAQKIEAELTERGVESKILANGIADVTLQIKVGNW